MERAVGALETVRGSDGDMGSMFDVWRRADDQIGTFMDDPLRTVLTRLRDRIGDDTELRAVADVQNAFARSTEEGWEVWLRTYAEAFCAWRQEVCVALTAAKVSFPAEARSVEHLHRMTRLVMHERWPEVHEFLIWLADQGAIRAELRARFRVFAGQVELYYNVEPKDALVHFRAAEALAPDDDVVIAGLGEHALSEGELERCREHFQRSIAVAPHLSDGYALMGDSYEQSGDLAVAEEWYRETIAQKPGESQGYLRLVRLLGRPELLATREAEILPLFERAVAVDPLNEYGACLEVGGAYRPSARYDDAQAWHDRAIALDPDRLTGYVAKGNAYLDAGDSKQAQAAFEKAIEVASESFEGYWGMALAFDQEEGCAQDAIAWLEKSLPLRPAWEGLVRGKMGALHLQCGRYAEAEEQLLEALRLQETDQSVLTSLQELASECYKPDSALSFDDARRILTEVRAIAGDSYEPTFQNLVGHLSYYVGDYEPAIAAYERAVELEPDEPVFHSNLAGAVELAAEPGGRAESLARALLELRRAQELDPDDPEYPARISALTASEGMIAAYGESALELPWTPPLIGIDVSQELVPEVKDAESGELTDALLEALEVMRERIRKQCGVFIPSILVGELPETPGEDWGSYTIKIREAAFPLERIPTALRFYPGTLEPLTQAGIPANVYSQAILGAWVAETHLDVAADAGLELQTPLNYMLAHLESVVRSNLHLLVDHEQVSALLAQLPTGDPFAASPERLTGLVASLRALVREGVPISAFDVIVREYAALTSDGLDQVAVVERLRSLPEVVRELHDDARETTILRWSGSLSADLEGGLVTIGDQPVLALAHEVETRIRQLVRAHVEFAGRVSLVVENPELRPFLRALIEPQCPDVPVFSMAELDGGDVEIVRDVGAEIGAESA